MVKIRLRRMGAKKRPFYRLVVAEHTSPRDGRFIDTIGYYDPGTQPATVKVDHDKARKWLSCGAQPTDMVRALLTGEGLIERPVRKAEAPAAQS